MYVYETHLLNRRFSRVFRFPHGPWKAG